MKMNPMHKFWNTILNYNQIENFDSGYNFKL